MNKINHAVYDLREMDELAAQRSPIHALHPAAKLFTTIAYILFTVSFHKYDLNRLFVMILYPAVMFALSGVSVRTCFYKLRFVLPLVCAVGLFNPLLDRAVLLTVGSVRVSGGVISMITLMLKGVFCLSASFLLVATTPIDSLCAALRQMHVPGLLVTLLLLTFRYVSVMLEEVEVMTEAYQLRAPAQKGIHISAWGSFLGQLLLRSMDRAEDLYSSMQLRGFHGEFYYARFARLTAKDIGFFALWMAVLALFRWVDLAQMLGQQLI